MTFTVWITHSFSLSVIIQPGFLKMQMNMMLEQNSWKSIPNAQKKQKKIVYSPCVLSLSMLQSSSYFWTCMSHMCSTITRSATRPHKRIMCYCSTFSFIIYSVKVPILTTLFSGQVKRQGSILSHGAER